MRKLSAILMLTIYLFTQVASVCWYFSKPISHAWFLMLQRKNLKDIGNNELLVITIDKDRKGEFANGNEEMLIDGMLYDIEHTVIKGNSIQLYLQKDEGETKWKDGYGKWNNLLHKQTPSKSATTTKAHGIFFTFFYSQSLIKDFSLHAEQSKKYYTLSPNNYNNPHQELVNPPPKNS